MNLKDGFNRIGHLLNDGVEKSHQAIGDKVDKQAKRAACVARRVQDQVDVRSLVSMEERIVQHMRDNPVLYLAGAALLIAALISRLIKEAREARDIRRAPLL